MCSNLLLLFDLFVSNFKKRKEKKKLFITILAKGGKERKAKGEEKIEHVESVVQKKPMLHLSDRDKDSSHAPK